MQMSRAGRSRRTRESDRHVKAMVICNPRAGKREADSDLEGAVNVLERAGWSIPVQKSTAPGDASHLAREAAAAGLDAVMVAGGDGTLNEAVQGLAGTDTALGYLPYGTVNIWARELNMPLDPEEAAR